MPYCIGDFRNCRCLYQWRLLALERLPLIGIKRCYYDEFLTGVKTIEYRRTKGSLMRACFIRIVG
jgi:hypothetical protein